ncbi:hypothetical protein NM688_g7077 [Phlebia brevispora]|uniref:Uncharacterized protein n=1 Tax=Phlebia brevispora TaxID=194682 RepID=A0ACC1S9J8_9APHY|nr:hypothetical protein NM688_g7077 [Phlebia brevispora]
MGMSGSDRFDIATGILSVLVLVFALLERAFPHTRLAVLEKCFKHVDADLANSWEEGLLGSDASNVIGRVNNLRLQADRLAARVHAASTIYLQFIEMCKGLSWSVSVVHSRLLVIQAEIASLRSTPRLEDKNDQQTKAVPAGSSARPDGHQSRSRSRRPSVSTLGRSQLSRSTSKATLASAASLSRSSTSNSSINTNHGRSRGSSRSYSFPSAKLPSNRRARSDSQLTAALEPMSLARTKSSSTTSSGAPELGIIQEDTQARNGRPLPGEVTTRGRRGTRSGMFYVPS